MSPCSELTWDESSVKIFCLSHCTCSLEVVACRPSRTDISLSYNYNKIK